MGNGIICECGYEQVKNIVLREINWGRKNFVIFPYEKYGKIVKEILDDNNGVSYILIDENKANEDENIYGLSVLEEKEYWNYTVLLCSNSLEDYETLRSALLYYAQRNKIIDVCLQGSLFSMLQYNEPRISALECVSREIYDRKIEGNVAEAGVYRGNFAKFINRFFYDRKLYLIDTFVGFDERDAEIDRINTYSSGTQDWSDTNIQLVLSAMKYSENCIVKKGRFPEIMENVKDKFCFVSLDMDLYQPTYAALHYFYPQLSHGGYIFIHDCRNLEYIGSRKAVMDFCDEMSIGYVPLQDQWGSAVITK